MKHALVIGLRTAITRLGMNNVEFAIAAGIDNNICIRILNGDFVSRQILERVHKFWADAGYEQALTTRSIPPSQLEYFLRNSPVDDRNRIRLVTNIGDSKAPTDFYTILTIDPEQITPEETAISPATDVKVSDEDRYQFRTELSVDEIKMVKYHVDEAWKIAESINDHDQREMALAYLGAVRLINASSKPSRKLVRAILDELYLAIPMLAGLVVLLEYLRD